MQVFISYQQQPWSYPVLFQRYCRFSGENSDPPLFYPNFGVFPLDWIATVGALRNEDSGVDYRQTDGQDMMAIPCYVHRVVKTDECEKYENVS